MFRRNIKSIFHLKIQKILFKMHLFHLTYWNNSNLEKVRSSPMIMSQAKKNKKIKNKILIKILNKLRFNRNLLIKLTQISNIKAIKTIYQLKKMKIIPCKSRKVCNKLKCIHHLKISKKNLKMMTLMIDLLWFNNLRKCKIKKIKTTMNSF